MTSVAYGLQAELDGQCMHSGCEGAGDPDTLYCVDHNMEDEVDLFEPCLGRGALPGCQRAAVLEECQSRQAPMPP